MTHRTHRLLLLAITAYAAAVRAWPGIGKYDFGSAWDEGYYAMVARGAAAHARNLIYPFVYEQSLDRVLINKPPGFFWVGALALELPLPAELGLRLVSVLAGVASVPLFDALCRLHMRRRGALLASLAFATSPLHVAFSRVYQMDVLVLLYALGAAYLLTRGIRRRSLGMIYAAAPLLGLALLTKLWVGVAPVLLLLPLLACEARRRRQPRLGAHVAFAIVLGAVMFALWPLAVSVWTAPYTGFLWMRRGSTVWDLLFGRYGSTRFSSDTGTLAGQLVAPYLSLGHFRESTTALRVEMGLALLGVVTVVVNVVRQRARLRLALYRALPVVLWTVAYLPVQLGRDHYLQYLVVLVPVWSVLIAQGLEALVRVPSRPIAWLSLTACAVSLLAEPVRLVTEGDEILYRTHYREIGAFIRARSGGARCSAMGRYAPGLSYYTLGMEKPFEARWPVQSTVAQGIARFVDVKRSDRDNTLPPEDRRWVEEHCTDVSGDAALPPDSLHALYDCREAQNPDAVTRP